MNIVKNTPKEELREVRNIQQKKLDREYAGRVSVKKSMTLFAMCCKTYEVYEVKKQKIESKKAKVNFATGKVIGKSVKEEYVFVKGDPVLWALNMKNAVRKFQKKVDEWYV